MAVQGSMRLRDRVRVAADAMASRKKATPRSLPPGHATRSARTPRDLAVEAVLGGRELRSTTRCLASGWISPTASSCGRWRRCWRSDWRQARRRLQFGHSAINRSPMLSGVQPDDEVIVPTVTFIAPVNAVRYMHACPVFVDCDEYCNMDVEGVRVPRGRSASSATGATINRRLAGGSRPSCRSTSSARRRTWIPIMALAGLRLWRWSEDASESAGFR